MDKIKHLIPEGYTFEVDKRAGTVLLKHLELDAQAQKLLDKSDAMKKYKSSTEETQKNYQELLKKETSIKKKLGQALVSETINKFMQENSLSFIVNPTVDVVEKKIDEKKDNI